MEEKTPPTLEDLREAIHNMIQHEITPEMVEEWTPSQRAWMMEHLELMMELSRDLINKLEAEMGSRRLGDGD